MEIVVYNFKKRVNSTKIPNEGGITVHGVYYKDIVDIDSPVIDISYFAPFTFNYLKIDNKYYFIDSYESVTSNIWRLRLSIDVLATYKNEILQNSVFIGRSSSKYNKYLVDDYNTTTARINRVVLQAEETGFYETGEGCYILEVINVLSSGVNSGFNAAYILTAEQMSQIALKLMTDNGLIEELKKSFQAPIDSIVSCKWLPLNYDYVTSNTGGVASKIFLGAYDTGLSGYIVSDNFIETNIDFNLTSYISNNYTSNQKYLDILMCIPFTGVTSIDLRQFAESSINNKILRVRICVDVRSGKQLAMIVPQDYPNAPINTYETIIAEDRPISSASTNVSSAIYTLASTAPMVASGGVSPAVIGGLATGLLQSATPSYTSIGSSGGSAFEGFGVSCRCIILRRETAYTPEDAAVKNTIGLPYNKADILSNMGTGYVQTINASVTVSANYDAVNKINDLLNGGVYLE